MTGYLDHVVRRGSGDMPTATPRPRSRYEPDGIAEGRTADLTLTGPDAVVADSAPTLRSADGARAPARSSVDQSSGPSGAETRPAPDGLTAGQRPTGSRAEVSTPVTVVARAATSPQTLAPPGPPISVPPLQAPAAAPPLQATSSSAQRIVARTSATSEPVDPAVAAWVVAARDVPGAAATALPARPPTSPDAAIWDVAAAEADAPPAADPGKATPAPATPAQATPGQAAPRPTNAVRAPLVQVAADARADPTPFGPGRGSATMPSQTPPGTGTPDGDAQRSGTRKQRAPTAGVRVEIVDPSSDPVSTDVPGIAEGQEEPPPVPDPILLPPSRSTATAGAVPEHTSLRPAATAARAWPPVLPARTAEADARHAPRVRRAGSAGEDGAPTVTVTIGRVEVRRPEPPPLPTPVADTTPPGPRPLSLGEYLDQRRRI